MLKINKIVYQFLKCTTLTDYYQTPVTLFHHIRSFVAPWNFTSQTNDDDDDDDDDVEIDKSQWMGIDVGSSATRFRIPCISTDYVRDTRQDHHRKCQAYRWSLRNSDKAAAKSIKQICSGFRRRTPPSTESDETGSWILPCDVGDCAPAAGEGVEGAWHRAWRATAHDRVQRTRTAAVAGRRATAVGRRTSAAAVRAHVGTAPRPFGVPLPRFRANFARWACPDGCRCRGRAESASSADRKRAGNQRLDQRREIRRQVRRVCRLLDIIRGFASAGDVQPNAVVGYEKEQFRDRVGKGKLERRRRRRRCRETSSRVGTMSTRPRRRATSVERRKATRGRVPAAPTDVLSPTGGQEPDAGRTTERAEFAAGTERRK